ncbi:hypothetical protein [Wolbachia endosymbiont of Ctenocephalides felis wCfeJ]|nr:hypothetical protein [Wolbachia endosymbiont of Ctenocephalides felis wCfeJ]
MKKKNGSQCRSTGMTSLGYSDDIVEATGMTSTALSFQRWSTF